MGNTFASTLFTFIFFTFFFMFKMSTFLVQLWVFVCKTMGEN